jgi:hypothetical protein
MRNDMKVCRHQCATLASILFLNRQETAVAVAERRLFSAPSVLQLSIRCVKDFGVVLPKRSVNNQKRDPAAGFGVPPLGPP